MKDSSGTESVKRTGPTPLGIIAIFVGLAETVAGLAAIMTDGVIQYIFATFAVLYPILIAGAFFRILWSRAHVFYPPQAYGNSVDVSRFAEAMRSQTLSYQELQVLVRQTIEETLTSDKAQDVVLQVRESPSSAVQSTLARAAGELASEAVVRLQQSVITVDVREFRKSDADPDLVFPFHADQDAFDFLSAVYYQLMEHIEPYTYGKSWALMDTTTGHLLLPDTIEWRDNKAMALSGALVGQLGLQAGMKVKVIRLPSKRSR